MVHSNQNRNFLLCANALHGCINLKMIREHGILQEHQKYRAMTSNSEFYESNIQTIIQHQRI